MSAKGGFHDLLFEMSNENRFEILLTIQRQARRITDITREMGLTTTEVRRHVARLVEVGVIRRDLEGYYHISPFGELILKQLDEIEFSSQHVDYFNDHTTQSIPDDFTKKISSLKNSVRTDNVLEFLLFSENIISDSEQRVLMLLDEFPVNFLSTIKDSIERGVFFRIIEPIDRVIETDPDLFSSDEILALQRTRQTPQLERRMAKTPGLYLVLSEKGCAISFPTVGGKFDYTGFTSSDEATLKWCHDLFERIWLEAEPCSFSQPPRQVALMKVMGGDSEGSTTVIGSGHPELDVQNLQNAVDGYGLVVLDGEFNLGNSQIIIRRSVEIRGTGRERDVPSTKIYKKGWKFPFTESDSVFMLNGDGISVTIENIHFTDFNNYCILGEKGRSVKVLRNRITLQTGLGRGQSLGRFGDVVIGINIGGPRPSGGFAEGVLIEGNYLDFATSYVGVGYLPRDGKELDPRYRPDLENHESYIGIGIVVNDSLGEVVIRNNVVRNMNWMGIQALNNKESAEVRIVGNTVVSEVFGVYPFSNAAAGMGIQVQSAWSVPTSGGTFEIANNSIRCDKLNYVGMAVYGPSIYIEGSGKLEEGLIIDNDIHLEDGLVGILLRKCDNVRVVSNRISGAAYYALQVRGSGPRDGMDLRACDNLFEENDLDRLIIKSPDGYSDEREKGGVFAISDGRSSTAHIWLNPFTSNNTMRADSDVTVIDEGEENTIILER